MEDITLKCCFIICLERILYESNFIVKPGSLVVDVPPYLSLRAFHMSCVVVYCSNSPIRSLCMLLNIVKCAHKSFLCQLHRQQDHVGVSQCFPHWVYSTNESKSPGLVFAHLAHTRFCGAKYCNFHHPVSLLY